MACEGGTLIELIQCLLSRQVFVLVTFEPSDFAADIT